MKNKLFMFLILIIIVLGIIFFINRKGDDKNLKAANLKIDITETVDCRKPKYLYFNSKGSNYYLVCLDEVNIILNKKKYPLKEAIMNGKITIDEIISELKDNIYYNNGEALMYRDASIDLNNFVDLSILKCDTKDGNKDYYIGNKEMTYNDSYCKRVCSFTRTYYISKIVELGDNKFTLTLKDEKTNKHVEITIAAPNNTKISVNNYYEFTFEKEETKRLEKDSMENIFKNFKIVKMEYTNKKGVSQKQEAICQIK